VDYSYQYDDPRKDGLEVKDAKSKIMDLIRPSMDAPRGSIDSKDSRAKFAWSRKESRPKLKSEVKEFTDIHTSQKIFLMMEDIVNEQKSGYLIVKYGLTKGDWRMQFICLDLENLWIFRTTPDDKSWRISLSKGYTVEEVNSEEKNFCFQFFCPPDHHFIFQADSQADREAWIGVFQKIQSTPLNQFRKNSVRDDVVKGAIKVFGESLNLVDKSKAILIDTAMSTEEAIKLVLQKFQVLDNPEKYGLFERNAEGEEYLINDSDRPLVVKSFWESQNRQSNFCIKERYPNIGLIEILQRSDVMKKASALTQEVSQGITSNSVEFSTLSLQSIISTLQDPLFLTDDTSLSVFNGMKFSDFSELRDRSASVDTEDDHEVKRRAGSVSDTLGNNNNNMFNFDRSADPNQGSVKNLLRLEAFGLEISQLTTE